MRIYRELARPPIGVLCLSHAATRRICWTFAERKPEKDSVKKFLRAKTGARGFESIESGGVKCLLEEGEGACSQAPSTASRGSWRRIPKRSIATAIWFWLGIAIYARFIRLPDLRWLLEEALF